MNDESTEESEKIEATEARREEVDLRDVPPGLGESWVHDDAFYSGGGPRLIVDVKGMLSAVEDQGHVLWVNPGRSEFRAAPSELIGSEKAGKIAEAGWCPARLIKVERAVEASEDPDIVDLTIEVYSRLETYRIEDAGGYFASEVDDVEIEEGDEIERVDEIAMAGSREPPIIDVENLRAFLTRPNGLSEDEVDARHVEAMGRVQAQLSRELEALDRQELWDFTVWLMKACHDAMKKK
jgi:hypothetical protein